MARAKTTNLKTIKTRRTKLLILVDGGIVQEVWATRPELIDTVWVSDRDKHAEAEILVSQGNITVATEGEFAAALAQDARGRWKGGA
jgi:hypothetical protein